MHTVLLELIAVLDHVTHVVLAHDPLWRAWTFAQHPCIAQDNAVRLDRQRAVRHRKTAFAKHVGPAAPSGAVDVSRAWAFLQRCVVGAALVCVEIERGSAKLAERIGHESFELGPFGVVSKRLNWLLNHLCFEPEIWGACVRAQCEDLGLIGFCEL